MGLTWAFAILLADTSCLRYCQSYIPECNWMSNACACTWMWICAWMLWCLYTSACCECLCVSLLWDSERSRQRERERERGEKKRKKERERAVEEERRGKLKLHDEYIGAQSPDRERQSEHRYTVSKQTVRSRGDFPMEAWDSGHLNTHGYTHRQQARAYNPASSHYKTNKWSHTHAYTLLKNTQIDECAHWCAHTRAVGRSDVVFESQWADFSLAPWNVKLACASHQH